LQNKEDINNISYDINIWLSPKIALESAIIIHDMLIKIKPQKKKIIDHNLQEFKANLLKLDKDISTNFLPIKEKKYFTVQNIYKYFEKHYKLNSLGNFEKLSRVQVGARNLYEIKQDLLQKKATCIFTELQFNKNIIDTIIRGTNIRKGILDSIGIAIPLHKNSYLIFLLQLSNQYIRCLQTP